MDDGELAWKVFTDMYDNPIMWIVTIALVGIGLLFIFQRPIIWLLEVLADMGELKKPDPEIVDFSTRKKEKAIKKADSRAQQKIDGINGRYHDLMAEFDEIEAYAQNERHKAAEAAIDMFDDFNK